MEKTQSTIRTYEYAMKRLSNNAFEGKKITDAMMDSEEGRKQIFEYLDKVKSIGSRMIMIASISHFTDGYRTVSKESQKAYTEKYKRYNTKLKIQRSEELEKPNEKDVDKMITMDEVKQLKNKYKTKLTDEYIPAKDIKYLLLSLYSNIEPLRGQDYYNTEISTKEEIEKDEHKDEKNYCLLDEGILVLNTGKTMKHYGQRIITLPDEVIEDIRQFQIKSKSKWLIPTTSDITKHMEQSHFSKVLQRTFEQEFGKGKTVGSSMLRKIFDSEKLKENPEFEQKLKEFMDVAKKMGHSITTQQLIYSRLKNAM